MSENTKNDMERMLFERKLLESLRELKETVEQDFPGMYETLVACLCVKLSMKISDNTLPIMMILLGPPATGKTTILNMIKALPDSYKSDMFTPSAFLSSYAGKSKEELEQIHLLKAIDGKMFLTPELAPTFSARDDALIENIGILTRVLDGQGLSRNTGVHGKISVDSSYFCWLGAMVDVPKNIWPLIGRLGAKQFFLRLGKEESYNDEKVRIIKNLRGKKYQERFDEVVEKLQKCYQMIDVEFLNQTDGKIPWDVPRDDLKALQMLADLAQLLARLRANIPTDDTDRTSGSNYAFMEPNREDAERALFSLYNIARGHAILHGRNFITVDDVPVVKSIVLSSASKERIELLKMLIKQKGQITTTEFCNLRKVTRTTALRIMKMLEILEIVDEVKVPGTTKYNMAIRLKEEFRWLLEEE